MKFVKFTSDGTILSRVLLSSSQVEKYKERGLLGNMLMISDEEYDAQPEVYDQVKNDKLVRASLLEVLAHYPGNKPSHDELLREITQRERRLGRLDPEDR